MSMRDIINLIEHVDLGPGPSADQDRLTTNPSHKMGKRIVKNDGSVLPFYDRTYHLELDPWYDYYRFIMQLGSENDFTDVAFKGLPLVQFYTKEEESRFFELCKKLGVKYKPVPKVEQGETFTVSPVPNPKYRDITL